MQCMFYTYFTTMLAKQNICKDIYLGISQYMYVTSLFGNPGPIHIFEAQHHTYDENAILTSSTGLNHTRAPTGHVAPFPSSSSTR